MTAVCYEEAEAAVALAENLLREMGAPPERLADEAERIRAALAVPRWRPLLGPADGAGVEGP